MGERKILFHAVENGGLVRIGNREYIKFPEKDGMVPVVAKDIVCNSVFGDNNDFRSSKVRKILEEKYLQEMIEAVGEENLCTIKTDLTALTGQKDYGFMEYLVSLPTLDFYRENVDTFVKYPAEDYWWMATPEAMRPIDSPYWLLCVSPSGCIFNCLGYDLSFGVRPFCLLKSSIFGS